MPGCAAGATQEMCICAKVVRSLPYFLTIAINEQVRRFVESHAIKTALRNFGRKQVPNYNCDVLTRGDQALQLWHLIIQEAVVHPLHHFIFKQVLQLAKIEHHPSSRIGLPFHSNLERVIVSVPMRIIALAENALVLLGGKSWIVVEVRSGALAFARQRDHWL